MDGGQGLRVDTTAAGVMFAAASRDSLGDRWATARGWAQELPDRPNEAGHGDVVSAGGTRWYREMQRSDNRITGSRWAQKGVVC